MMLDITRAHVLGPALRLVGEARLDEQTSGILLHHPGLAVPNQVLVDARDVTERSSGSCVQAGAGRTASFDLTVAIDLLDDGLKRLGFMRLRRDGGIEPARATLADLVFPGMQPGGINHAHMVETLTRLGRPLPALSSMLHRFESLGDNCEFGVFTKAFGNRRPSLLGYGGTSEWMATPRRPIAPLCEALLSAFDGLGEEGDLSFERHRGEWISHSRRFGFVFHTGLFADLEPQELRHREGRRLRFARRIFMQDLDNPSKIFVRRSNGLETEADMRDLRRAMDRLGQAWMLWVDRASDAEPAITVTLRDDRMLRLTHAALRDYDGADDPDLDSWAQATEAAFLVAELVQPGWRPSCIVPRTQPGRATVRTPEPS